MQQGSSRERLLREAARLFAEHGYSRTSVGEIQQAAGLNAGSGALYKHFPSKRAVLEAVVTRHIEAYETGRAEVLPALPEDPTEALQVLGRGLLAQLDRDRDVVRIILRDLDEFPELAEEVRSRLLGPLYDDVSRWLQAQAEAGRLRDHDSPATAAVMVAAITYLPILDALINLTPGGIDRERFLRAWLELADSLAPRPQ